ncbi:MAG TPA: FAD/NAD(P)-binding protein [Caldisericia bacterium]|nr:FAD/NAD(P)-binding protein [Caldisericia bacterium]HPF48805.1 FAD/NAD(P)-binding protein [Caldisericia bacterium]HPI84271.1 FAD/NAD(P)-binding protein [Caldisericia bacterium]HPQ93449.1 FAD/NAD(P)-binding protein [Caldisericia bacterium]HRV74907.1 FAD/NAD(P)-binding protein [Caldisericia bacterium]
MSAITGNSYKPIVATIKRIETLTPTEKIFEIELPNGDALGHGPGQFVQLLVPGIGEAPISICSSPTDKNFELTIRKVGDVTTAMHNIENGAKVGIRGPFGFGFPMDKLQGNDILVVAGGIGLAPLRSVIRYILAKRDEFGRFIILHGARTPEDRLFKDELDRWTSDSNVELYETVDKPTPDWKGNGGVITTLFKQININAAKTYALICGPPVMYKFVILECQSKGIADNRILASLERHMKCGLGKCGHCQINGNYCCQQGPVFTFTQIRNLEEAL